MIYELFFPLFNFLGIGNILLPFDTLLSVWQTDITNWWLMFNPSYIISWIIYVGFAFGAFFVICVVPFRWFKKLIRVPKRKW